MLLFGFCNIFEALKELKKKKSMLDVAVWLLE